MDNLREQLAILKTGYLTLITDKDILVNWGQPQLEALYNTRIGVHKIQLLELQLVVKGLKRKLEWIRSCVNRGISPNFNEIELIIDMETVNAQAQIMAEAEKIYQSQELLDNLSSPTDTRELKKIYYTIAKNLHPDINPDLTDSQKKIWQLVLDAYKECDADKLKALSLVYEKEITREEKFTGNTDEIQLQIETLRRSCMALQEQITTIKSQFPFTIEDNLKNEQWVKEQVYNVEQEVNRLRVYKSELETEYSKLINAYE